MALFLFTYVFVPRLGLLIYSHRREKRALDLVSFGDRPSEALFRRIAKPTIVRPTPQGDPQGNDDTAPPEKRGQVEVEPQPPADSHAVLFTEMDIADDARGPIVSSIEERLSLPVSGFHSVYSPAERVAAFASLEQVTWSDGIPRVILLYRANHPIIIAVRELVDGVLKKLGRQGHLIFLLVGARDPLADPVPREHRRIWEDYALQLASQSPNVSVETLIPTTQ